MVLRIVIFKPLALPPGQHEFILIGERFAAWADIWARLALSQEETGVDVPSDFTINAVDNNFADLTVVLPDFVDATGEELSDADLEAVSCGSRCGASCGGSSGICS